MSGTRRCRNHGRSASLASKHRIAAHSLATRRCPPAQRELAVPEPVGALWVPETRPWWLTCRDAGRRARGRRGFFVSFSPAVSPNAKKAIGKQISHWHLNRRSATDLAGLAGAINARIRGWFNYYGASTAPSCMPSQRASTNISSDGRCRSSNDCEANPPKRKDGSTLPASTSHNSSLTDTSSPQPHAGPREPYDGRLSRTVLTEREGEVPSRHSPPSRRACFRPPKRAADGSRPRREPGWGTRAS